MFTELGGRTWLPLASVTLLGTNIYPQKGTFEDDVPFPKVGYVSSLEGSLFVGGLRWAVVLGGIFLDPDTRGFVKLKPRGGFEAT